MEKNKGKVRCFNTDIRLLKYVQRLLRVLEIETTGPRIRARKGVLLFDKKGGKTYRTRKDVYSIYVKGRDRLRFYRLVGFTIQRKKQRLEEYLRRCGLLETPPTGPPPNSPQPSH